LSFEDTLHYTWDDGSGWGFTIQKAIAPKKGMSEIKAHNANGICSSLRVRRINNVMMVRIGDPKINMREIS